MGIATAELLDVLRALARRSPASRGELAELERDCVALARHIRRTPGLPDLPELIWHFLSDADIRYKDPEYAGMQLAALADCLSQVQLAPARLG